MFNVYLWTGIHLQITFSSTFNLIFSLSPPVLHLHTGRWGTHVGRSPPSSSSCCHLWSFIHSRFVSHCVKQRMMFAFGGRLLLCHRLLQRRRPLALAWQARDHFEELIYFGCSGKSPAAWQQSKPHKSLSLLELSGHNLIRVKPWPTSTVCDYCDQGQLFWGEGGQVWQQGRGGVFDQAHHLQVGFGFWWWCWSWWWWWKWDGRRQRSLCSFNLSNLSRRRNLTYFDLLHVSNFDSLSREGEFSCLDGQCINIEQRCDQTPNCRHQIQLIYNSWDDEMMI